MTTEGTSTISKLVELFHLSRSKGEKVSLSMESKDGKDSLIFSINNLSGSPVGQAGSWTPPAPSSPWTWPPPPRPWPHLLRRKKTPSQMKRDQKRKQEFLAKKAASAADVKKEVIVVVEAEKATIVDPVDEILLTEIPAGPRPDTKLWKVVGKFKNPSRKSWLPVDPEMDCKLLWEQVEERDRKFEMEEIGDGSSYSENHIEFWGTWKVKQEETGEEFLNNSNNWPKGIEILEVKPG